MIFKSTNISRDCRFIRRILSALASCSHRAVSINPSHNQVATVSLRNMQGVFALYFFALTSSVKTC
jgi:hypothetical protein